MIYLKDKLAHLSFRQACKLLGPEGEMLIREGGKYHIDLSEQVTAKRDLFSLDLGEAVVTIGMDPKSNKQLNFQCSACTTACEHVGAFFP